MNPASGVIAVWARETEGPQTSLPVTLPHCAIRRHASRSATASLSATQRPGSPLSPVSLWQCRRRATTARRARHARARPARRGAASRVARPPSAPSSSSASAGSSQACIARLNVPQCTGRNAPPPSSASAFERVLGPEVDVAPRRMERADLEHHQIERAEAFADRRVLRREAGVAAEEHGVAFASGSTNDDHSVALRSFRPRPEKCCDGAAVIDEPGARQPRATPTSRARRCARAARPTPRGARRRRAT